MNTPRANVQAERDLIGLAMVEPRILEDVELAPEDFHHPAFEALWRLILERSAAGRPTDSLALAESLPADKPRGLTPLLIAELISDSSPWRAWDAPNLAELIRGTAQARRGQALAVKLGDALTDAPLEALPGILDGARADLDAVADAGTGTRVRALTEGLAEAIPVWENPDSREVYPTGWAGLDDLLSGGWVPGQITVLGARPAVGKSLFATCCAVAGHGYGVGFFSLETTERELLARIVASATGVKLANLTGSALTPAERERVRAFQRTAAGWAVMIEERPRITMAQIRATVRSWKRRQPVRLVIVDYLQLVAPADNRESRERQVARIAEDAKAMAKELNVHVLLLAQVNRKSADRDDMRPRITDLRESGGIEANADAVALLHRPEGGDGVTLEVLLEKNRHGRVGILELVWRPDLGAIQSAGAGPRDYPHGRPGALLPGP